MRTEFMGEWKPAPERVEIGKRINVNIQNIFNNIKDKHYDDVVLYYMDFDGYKLRVRRKSDGVTKSIKVTILKQYSTEEEVEKEAIICLERLIEEKQC